jgi:hypothetical protein
MPSYDQGFQIGAKFGTVFYGTATAGDWATLAVDLSQDDDDLVDGTDSIYAINDPRFNRSSPRAIHLELTIANTTDGTLFLQGVSGTEQSLYVVNGRIFFAVNGNDVGLMTPTGLTSTARTHQLAWVTEPNPDATGAGDAELSWLFCWNENTSVASRAGPFPHEAAAADDDLVVFGAFDSGGTDSYTDDITIVSFHHRALTLREVHNDHVTAAGTLSTDCTLDREAIPLTLESGIGAQDQCYGPTHYWAARNHQNLRRRTATARAHRFPALSLSDSYASASEEWIYAVPGTDYRAHLGHIMAIPVQPTCNRLWVRAHVKLWVTSGSAVPIGLRVYSCNRPFALFEEADAEPLELSYLGEVVTRNDGALGTGSWTLEGFLTIKRSGSADAMRESWTYIALAWAIDPAAASANDANARVQWNAIHLVPCYATPVPNGPGSIPGEGS